MPDPEAASRRTDSRSPSVPPLGLPRQLFYYLVVGGLSVVVDIGLLALLHETLGVPLGVATTVAFCTAVVMNFLLNRTAMSSWGSRGLTHRTVETSPPSPYCDPAAVVHSRRRDPEVEDQTAASRTRL